LRFILIDRIIEVVPNKSITAIKTLSLGEEYLRDHFPGRPIMPGLMMTESAVETASWLLRIDEGFEHSMITLKEARNVKYNQFISPGDSLTVHAEILRIKDNIFTFKATGSVNSTNVLNGRLLLEVYNLADRDPALVSNDKAIIEAMKKRFQILATNEVFALVGGQE